MSVVLRTLAASYETKPGGTAPQAEKKSVTESTAIDRLAGLVASVCPEASDLVRWTLEGRDPTTVLGSSEARWNQLLRLRDCMLRLAQNPGDLEPASLWRQVGALGVLVALVDVQCLGAEGLHACRTALGGQSGNMLHGVQGRLFAESHLAMDAPLCEPGTPQMTRASFLRGLGEVQQWAERVNVKMRELRAELQTSVEPEAALERLVAAEAPGGAFHLAASFLERRAPGTMRLKAAVTSVELALAGRGIGAELTDLKELMPAAVVDVVVGWAKNRPVAALVQEVHEAVDAARSTERERSVAAPAPASVPPPAPALGVRVLEDGSVEVAGKILAHMDRGQRRILRAEGNKPNRLAIALVQLAQGERPRLSAGDARKLSAALDASGIRGVDVKVVEGRAVLQRARLTML